MHNNPIRKNSVGLETQRHSLSHIMALAVKTLYPKVKFGIGPAIENGFYYDFALPAEAPAGAKAGLSEDDLPKIEEKMRAILKQNLVFKKQIISKVKARQMFRSQPYKLDLIKDLPGKNTSIYNAGNEGGETTFTDLCRGPHIKNTAEINPQGFKLTKVAGAYWRGDEKNPMLTRIYGLYFTTEKELNDYLTRQTEAEKRDHRKLGRELDLFVFSELVGPGLPLYTPKGFSILKEIINYSRELNASIGYQEVHTPNMNKADLFKTSGHYEKYKEDMFRVVSNYTKEEYYLKPMNCPQHTQIYASKARSYRDLPIRIADFANLYRDERPGELSGLARLRAFRQDDGHSFCREDQIKKELRAVSEVIEKAMKTYGMQYKIRLSLRDPKHPEKYLGSGSVWKKAENLLEEFLIENKIKYFKAKGEAAIYGPKMDLISQDSLGREWQLSTVQVDFIMPQRFGLKYIDEKGKEQDTIMVHRALVGSPERFLGILIEHYAGAFPLWLSPVQARILPITEKHNDYAKKIAEELKKNGIKAEAVLEADTLSKKIRESEMQKIPYLLIVGDKEIASNNVSVRQRNKGDLGQMPTNKLISQLLDEIRLKK